MLRVIFHLQICFTSQRTFLQVEDLTPYFPVSLFAPALKSMWTFHFKSQWLSHCSYSEERHVSMWVCDLYSASWYLSAGKYHSYLHTNSSAVGPPHMLYCYCIHVHFYPFLMCDSSSTEPVFVLSRAVPGVPACPPSCSQTHIHSAAIHLTSGLTSSYPCKYVQGQESVGEKDTVFLHCRFLSWHTQLPSGDMNSLLSLVKYLSVYC